MTTSFHMTVLGQCKSGKNNMLMTRSGHKYPNPSWAKWRDEVLKQLKMQWNEPIIDHPCLIVIKYYPGDLRRRDVPGMIDALFHCFERAQIVSDDKLFVDVLFTTLPLNRDNARVDIEIKI